MEQTKRFKWKRLPLLILGLLALAGFLGKAALELHRFYQVKWQPLALAIETEAGKMVDVFIDQKRTLDGRLVLLVKHIKGDAGNVGAKQGASSLAKGDVIFEVNGEQMTHWDDALTKRTAEGVTFTVMRQGTRQQVHLQLRGARGAPEYLASFRISTQTFYLRFVLGTLGLSMLGMGLLVYLKSETQPATLMLLTGIVLTGIWITSFIKDEDFLATIIVVLVGLCMSLLLHFLLIFPQKKKIVEKFGRAVYFIYLPSIVLLVLFLSYPTLDEESIAFAIIMIYSLLLPLLYIILGFIALLHSYKKATSPVIKGQTRTLLFGFGVALLTPILIYVFGIFSGLVLKKIPPDAIFLPIPAFLLAIPLSFGYAILRQGMLDVNFVIKKSVSYLAITVMAVGLYLGIVMGVGKGLLALAGGASQTLTIGATLLVAVLFAPMRSWTRRVIDSKFYRQRYDAHELLAQFSRDLPSMMELPDILSALTERLTSALYPRSLSILLPSTSGEEFIVAETIRDAPRANLLKSDESGLIKQLQETRQPFVCYQLEAVSQSFTEADIALLQSQETVLCVPMLIQDRLAGILNLGFKRSELPYNSEDLTLLRTVAGNAAIAVENARLSAQKAEQERMQEELDRARQIQLAILPETPSIEGFEIASFCEPATEVGGDYYDFVPLPPVQEGQVELDGRFGGTTPEQQLGTPPAQQLGFAIGDATGHGMPAALLVNMAHGCLHATTRKGASVEEVMESMNAMVYSVSARERLMKMTFAYSIINPHERHLQFSNAGHLPPYHYAAATDTLRIVEHGDFPLGVRQSITYTTQTVPIAPGDRLIYFSDGFIEAFNEAGELYGFERFEASIQRHIREPVEEMLKLMLTDVQSYCQDAPQEDDMTLVIIALY